MIISMSQMQSFMHNIMMRSCMRINVFLYPSLSLSLSLSLSYSSSSSSSRQTISRYNYTHFGCQRARKYDGQIDESCYRACTRLQRFRNEMFFFFFFAQPDDTSLLLLVFPSSLCSINGFCVSAGINFLTPVAVDARRR